MLTSGKSPLDEYSLGTLNASNNADLVFLSELHMVLHMLQAVSYLPMVI